MQPIVNGATRLLFIVGDPIAQVRSPLIYNPKIEAHGKNCILLPLQIPQQAFEQTIASIMGLGNLEGLIITFPFKERIMPFIRHISGDAALIGAVNAVKRNAQGEWCGDIFDGIGMIRAVQALGQSITGRKALLYGAGGAGKAIAAALLSHGAVMLTIIDRDRSSRVVVIQKRHLQCDADLCVRLEHHRGHAKRRHRRHGRGGQFERGRGVSLGDRHARLRH
jgi:shikimate dehydrogenase